MLESAGYDTTQEILTRMRMGVEFRWPIRIRNFEIYVRPLSMAETIEVLSRVASDMRKSPEIYRNATHEHALMAKEHLIVATSSQPGANDFQLTHALLNDFTPDEIILLYKEYISVTEKCDPAIENIPAEKLKLMVEELKKTPKADMDSELTALSFSQLKALVSFLIKND